MSAGKMDNDMVDETDEEQGGTLYGTNINIRRAMTSVEQFLINFKVDDQNVYWNQLIEMQDTHEAIFHVDGRHIR